jgi:hypothetical protein
VIAPTVSFTASRDVAAQGYPEKIDLTTHRGSQISDRINCPISRNPELMADLSGRFSKPPGDCSLIYALILGNLKSVKDEIVQSEPCPRANVSQFLKRDWLLLRKVSQNGWHW